MSFFRNSVTLSPSFGTVEGPVTTSGLHRPLPVFLFGSETGTPSPSFDRDPGLMISKSHDVFPVL